MPSFNQFGHPLITRKEEISKKLTAPEYTHSIAISGELHQLPVITVSLDFPSYRLKNGRTKTAQLEYVATHQGVSDSLFIDQESYDAQAAQHEVLKTLVNEENLLDSFKKERQIEPIICTDTGVVVNGNRRLCAWRLLYYSDMEAYKSFGRIKVAILPPMSEQEICSFEKELQLITTKKANYHWHTKALMAQEDLSGNRTEAEVAPTYEMSAKELHVLIEAKKYAQQYLETIARPNEWSLVDKSEFAFRQIVDGMKRISSTAQKELFLQLAFDIIKNGEKADERLYSVIQKYSKEMPTIIDTLIDTMPEEYQSSSSPVDNDPVSLLVGGGSIKVDNAVVISEAIDHGMSISHEAIKTALEEKKALQQEGQKSKMLIENLSKISSSLTSIINVGLNENTKREGVKEQLKSIEDKLAVIKKWISE